MLTSEQVRERLGISQRTLFRLVMSGQIEATKTRPGKNGRYRFSEEALETYIRRNRVKPDKAKAAS
jgi:excisionase family DNA binding protein